ncbi:MAG: lipoyl(octanoyl) transferase [Bdellovibrionales bacterium CG10_big_fil_rev_8_21_14_0_10_45_34]|nr:MAG: lipoyl(octanoyl) transferase [Bdellovibrionales bacterium CG10_big_fil_rev_8_21_14_0_10_45_34]
MSNSVQERKVECRWLGLLDYQEGLGVQAEVFHQVNTGFSDIVLGMICKPVITLGRSTKLASVQIGSAARSLSVPIVQTDRGGQITFHDPSQLVIYPVLNLRKRAFGVREWVKLILQSTERVLKQMGADVWVDYEKMGVFCREGKIASLGIRISHGISTHGLAIQVSPPPEWSHHLNLCSMGSFTDGGVRLVGIDELIPSKENMSANTNLMAKHSLACADVVTNLDHSVASLNRKKSIFEIWIRDFGDRQAL